MPTRFTPQPLFRFLTVSIFTKRALSTPQLLHKFSTVSIFKKRVLEKKDGTEEGSGRDSHSWVVMDKEQCLCNTRTFDDHMSGHLPKFTSAKTHVAHADRKSVV